MTGIRSELDALKGRIVDLEKQITEQFPRYAELTRREPLSLAGTQSLLGPDEALLTFIHSLDDENSHVFVVGRDRSAAYTVELGVEELTDEINELRIALDFKVGGMSFDLGVAHTLSTPE